jgi:hypothetical protein
VTLAGEGFVGEATSMVWAVLNDAGEIIVIAEGADAGAFAAEWAELGARVVELRGDAVVAA